MTRFDSDTLLPDEEQQADDGGCCGALDGDVAVHSTGMLRCVSCSLDEELVLDRLARPRGA
jgi:hypothetical protein